MQSRSALYACWLLVHCSGYSTQELLDGKFVNNGSQIAATLINPPNNANVTIESQFTWTSAADSRSYRLEISANADISAPLVVALIKSAQYTISTSDMIGISALTEQVYYWRVTTIYGTKQERSAIFRMILYDKDIIYVNSTSASADEFGNLTAPFKTIQPALNFASQNAKTKVYVAQGTYAGPIALATGVSLQGGYNATAGWSRNIVTNTTSITLSSGLIAVTTPPGATSATAIDGFTIQNSTSTGLSSTGIYIAGGSPTISNNAISAGGSTLNYGIYMNNNASSLITANTIYGGAGVNTRGIYVLASSPSIYNNVISGGTGTGANIGVYTDNSTAKISNNTINGGNTGATVYGIWLTVAGDSATITNNIIFCTGGTTQYGVYKNTAGAEPASLQNNNIFGCTGALYQNAATSFDAVCTTTGNFHTNTMCGGTALSSPTGSGNVSIDNSGSQLFVNQNGPDANIMTLADNNWRLQTGGTICNVRGGGLTITGITLDRSGLGRTATSLSCASPNVGATGWSMGAYESD